MGKIAIVIGATGLVGRALVEQLVQAEHISKIVTLTRKVTEHASLKVVNHVVDFDHLQDHAGAFNGDILFSCLGTTIKQAGSVAAQRKVDVEYQFQAAQLAANNGVDHYLLVSSSGANANSGRSYLKMKGDLEQRVQSLPFKRISIFQPSLLLGQRNHFRVGEKVGSWVMNLLCFLPMLRRFRPITGDQVAAKLVQVSQQDGAPLAWFRLEELFVNEQLNE